MNAIPARPSLDACPVCGGDRAVLMRRHAVYCSARCRKVANKAKKRLLKPRAVRRPHAKTPAGATMSTIAIRATFGGNEPFTLAQASVAAGRSGAHLARDPLAKLLAELVKDGLLERSVAPSGARTFRFPVIRGRRLSEKAPCESAPPERAPKRGVRAGATHGGTDSSLLLDHDSPPPPAPQAQGQGREAAAPITHDPSVKMIAPPTIDGGTAFTLEADAQRWNDQLRHLLTLRDQGGRKSMPETVTLHTDDGELFEAVVASGPHGSIALELEDDARLELYDRSGFVVLITKADALWREGLEVWVRKWFDLASWLLLGQRCPSPERAFDIGWRTRNVELCADFTGLDFHDADLRRFVGARGGAVRCDSEGFTGKDAVETITLGERGRDSLSLSTHNKTQAIRKRLKVEPEDSVYSFTWRSHEWDGKAVVRRVEVRAAGRALRLQLQGGGTSALDLTPPASLLDSAKLRLLWSHATDHRFRLVLPPKKGNDLRHQDADPRWVAVQRAAGASAAPRLVVDQSEVIRKSLAVLRDGAVRDLRRALARAAGLNVLDDIAGAVFSLVTEVMADPVFERRVSAARASRDARAGREMTATCASTAGWGRGEGA